MVVSDNVYGEGADLLAQLDHGYVVDILIDLPAIKEPGEADGKVPRGDQALDTGRLPEVRGFISKVKGRYFWGNWFWVQGV